MNQQRMNRQKWFDVVFILVMTALALLGNHYDPFPGEGCEQPSEGTENVFDDNSTN